MIDYSPVDRHLDQTEAAQMAYEQYVSERDEEQEIESWLAHLDELEDERIIALEYEFAFGDSRQWAQEMAGEQNNSIGVEYVSL